MIDSAAVEFGNAHFQEKICTFKSHDLCVSELIARPYDPHDLYDPQMRVDPQRGTWVLQLGSNGELKHQE